METLEIAVSKANAIRFSHVNGLMKSFDNQLSFNEKYFNKVNKKFDQTFFKDDVIIVQLKAGLTATVVLTKIMDDDTTSVIAADATTTYAAFKIYDYVITLGSVERFYFTATSESSSHTSECINVIDEVETTNNEYVKIEWTNLDAVSDTFQFDYSTADAIANVNYMRVRGQTDIYKPAGESTVYDNQNEVSKIKGNYYRDLVLETEPMPKQIAEILIIAMQHDTFLVNDVGYVVQELAEIGSLGSFVQISATLRLVTSLGMNADDIGFDCDSSGSNSMIENKVQAAASGAQTFSVSSGFAITQIIIKKLTGTPVVKMGNSVGGEQIMVSRTITSTTPPLVININYAPDITGAWTIYVDTSGGTCDIFVQTIQITA